MTRQAIGRVLFISVLIAGVTLSGAEALTFHMDGGELLDALGALVGELFEVGFLVLLGAFYHQGRTRFIRYLALALTWISIGILGWLRATVNLNFGPHHFFAFLMSLLFYGVFIAMGIVGLKFCSSRPAGSR